MPSLKLLAVFVCYITVTAACSANEGCTSCVLDSACGYCSGSRTCMAGTKEGPSNNATCIEGWSFDTCICSDPQSCQACFEYGCVWCQGWDQNKGMCVNKGYKPNATCPLQWNPDEICPSAVDEISLLTFAIVGSGLVITLSAFGLRWFWKNKSERMKNYFNRFKDEPNSA